jgi:hypothetical protein
MQKQELQRFLVEFAAVSGSLDDITIKCRLLRHAVARYPQLELAVYLTASARKGGTRADLRRVLAEEGPATALSRPSLAS